MRAAKLLLLLLAGSEVGGEADHACLLAVLVEEHRSRDQGRNALRVLRPQHALKARSRAAALAHLEHKLSRSILVLVELGGGAAGDLAGAIAQQGLGALVEQNDVAQLVGGDNGVRRALDQPRQVTLGLLKLGVRLKSIPFCFLALGNIGPRADELEGMAGIVVDDLQGVLDPNVMPVTVAEAIFDAAAAAPDQREHFAEGPRSVIGVEMIGPALGVDGDLLRPISHDGAQVLAAEGAGVVAGGLGGVDGGGTSGEEVLQPLARALELLGDRLALGLERLEIV